LGTPPENAELSGTSLFASTLFYIFIPQKETPAQSRRFLILKILT
jgi:hypothetical protein